MTWRHPGKPCSVDGGEDDGRVGGMEGKGAVR